MVDRVNFEYLGKSIEYQKMLHVENDSNIGKKFKLYIVSMKHSEFVENSTYRDQFSKFSGTKNIPQIIIVKYCEKQEQIDTQRKTSYKI